MIGDAIRAERQKQGLTQAALAAAAGVSRQFLNEVENGGTVTHATLLKIAAALNVDPSILDPTYVGDSQPNLDPRLPAYGAP